jgi:hypothetical protein
MAPEETVWARATPGRRRGWLVLPVVALGVVAAMVWLLVGSQRRFFERFEAQVAARGWLVEGGSIERGAFSRARGNVRLSLRDVAGVSASVDRIETKKMPFAAPQVSLGHVRAKLRGEPTILLDAIRAALPAGDARLAPTRLDFDYQHPRLGVVRFEEVRFESRGTWFVLRARKVEAAGRDFTDVVLSMERRKDMLLVALGESPSEGRLQLACFPPRQGVSRWILSVLHQGLRPLARAVGWTLGGDFDPAKVAGALTFELPEAGSASVEGRISVVFDRWPTTAPPGAEPLVASTVSFLSNIVLDQDLSSGRLPRLELKMPVFSLVGAGRVGPGPALSFEASGQRTCRELKSLLPPSDARERVVRFVDSRSTGASRNGALGQTSLRLRLDASEQAGQAHSASWSFEPGCGL